MDRDRLRDRITRQFSYRGDRADVWRVFDLFLATDAYLNLGYSPWYLPHVLGSPQRRLAVEVGRQLETALGDRRGRNDRLLDVACGRGGPSVVLANRFGFDVTGVDLVEYNVARARETARTSDADVDFLVGDATRLPFRSDCATACTAIDALVYLPDRAAVLAEVADVLEPGGVLVVSDLVVADGLDADARRAVGAFADAWDMPVPETPSGYERALDETGFEVLEVADISAHSVDRFRKWTTAFLAAADGPLGGPIDRILATQNLDGRTITTQVRRAHRALPSLGHRLIVASATD